MSRARADASVTVRGRAVSSRLTHRFTGALHQRRTLKHFGRHPLGDALAGHGPTAPPPEELALSLLLVARDMAEAAIVRLESHSDGLSAREAAARLARTGANEVEHEKPVPWWLHLWHCYKDPFNLLLTALAVVSYLSADIKATTVIGVMVGLSTLIRFVQEGRSRRAAESLKAMVSNTATVIRRGAGPKSVAVPASPKQVEIPIRQVVRGDLVVLTAGDMIPADCRILGARDLFVAQPQWQWLDMDSAVRHCTTGAGVWAWASNDEGDPDVVMACAGDVPTLERLAAVTLLREYVPDIRIRVVNVVDLMVLQPQGEHPHGLTDVDFDALFTVDRPVIFAFHGYPAMIHKLTYRRHNHENIHVRGYKEEGTTTTPFDMVVLNDLDRYRLALDAIQRIPRLHGQVASATARYWSTMERHKLYIGEHGDDMPEVRDWRWSV